MLLAIPVSFEMDRALCTTRHSVDSEPHIRYRLGMLRLWGRDVTIHAMAGDDTTARIFLSKPARQPEVLDTCDGRSECFGALCI